MQWEASGDLNRGVTRCNCSFKRILWLLCLRITREGKEGCRDSVVIILVRDDCSRVLAVEGVRSGKILNIF